MTEAASYFAAWSNFYVVTGAAAASLTGLTFVVITLIMRRIREQPGAHDGIGTFTTPTVLHFSAVLLISALIVAPWHSLTGPAVLLGLAGLGGMAYAVRVIYRTKHMTMYTADLEDWIWYPILPLFSYAVMLAGAIALFFAPVQAMFVLAASILFLLVIGIHNSWDVVTYIAISMADEEQGAKQDDGP